MVGVRGFAVRAEGLADLRRDFRNLDRESLKHVRDALKAAAGIAAREASEIAPRKSGALAASYKPFTRGNVAGVRSPLPYAGVIEYGGTIAPKGTRITIPRRAPVQTAIARRTNEIVDALGDGIEEAARKSGFH